MSCCSEKLVAGAGDTEEGEHLPLEARSKQLPVRTVED
jgi:hypothetical protein